MESAYSSSLNTPVVPVAQRQESGSSLEVNPPSPRFDSAMYLDDTLDFMSMMAPQAVVVNEEESGFAENEDEWSNQLLSQVLDLQNMVEQRHQQEQQQQQVQEAPSSSSSS